MKLLKYLSLILVGIALLFSYSCEEDEDRNLVEETFVKFTSSTGNFGVTNTANPTFDIIVGLTKPASKDIILPVSIIDSLTTAVLGTHFSEVPSTVTIAKGESTGTLTITGIFAGFVNDNSLSLAIKLGGDISILNSKDMFTVTMFRSCPLTIDDFVGTFNAVETRSGIARDITVEIVKESAISVRVKAQNGIPGFHSSVFIGWGETFVDGFGLNGDILMTIGLSNGTVSFNVGEYWGRTDYDYDYWYTGNGSWNGCNMTMNITFRLHWDDANFTDAGDRVCTIVLDLASKK